MKKVDWENVRYIIFYVCLGLIIVFGTWTVVLFFIYTHDKYETLRNYAFTGLGVTSVSIVIGFITSLVDYVCEHKKRKKLEYVQQRVIIEEDIVV